jgi:hypothetical protein
MYGIERDAISIPPNLLQLDEPSPSIIYVQLSDKWKSVR